MEFELSPDQRLLLDGLQGLLEPFRRPPAGVHGYVEYSAVLQRQLMDSGYLEVAAQPEYGPLEAALLAEEIASCPVSVEAAASALVGPLLTADGPNDATPLALAWGLGTACRFLPQARRVCLMQGDEVWVGTPQAEDLRPIDSIVAYPLATLRRLPRDSVQLLGGSAVAVRRRALISLAVEATGAMRGALDLTVQHVKDRQQFGQPLGHFQAIQHRLAEDAQRVHASRLLSLRAAFADDDRQAFLACLYVQDALRKIIYDCHQFTGAMGLTLEYPLHLWTYRLKCLQGEAGGRGLQAQRLAQAVWPASRG